MKFVWCIKRQDERDIGLLTLTERDAVLDYLARVEASKYAQSPNVKRPYVVFEADVSKVSTAASEYSVPTGFETYTVDIDYMPLAWANHEDEYEAEMEWFFRLPKGFREL